MNTDNLVWAILFTITVFVLFDLKKKKTEINLEIDPEIQNGK